MQFLKSKFKQLVNNDLVRRVFHTFWQAFLAVFGLGSLGIISSVLSTHNFTDAKSAALALVVAAVAAGIAAVKAVFVARS